jgi:YidC/Oxa1 family membrane protein insertase
MPIGEIWQTALETPLINFMVLLTVICFGSFGLAILVFTVISRAIMFPLTLRTLHAARAMQEIQPQMKEIQRKYSDPRRRSEETMKLYREAGVNPLGCIGPQLVQFPIFIALYQVIRITLGTTPESVVNLSHRLYDYDVIQRAVPLSTHFLGLDLAENGGPLLAIAVGVSMWLQQRISTSRNAAAQNDQQRQMNQMMQWMLPVLFGWFVLAFPSGLGLYWAASTVIGIVLQWIFVGPGDFTWGSLIPAAVRGPLGMSAPAPAPSGPRRGRSTPTSPPSGESADGNGTEQADADSGNQRQNGRRRRRPRSRSTRSSPRSGRRRGDQGG